MWAIHRLSGLCGCRDNGPSDVSAARYAIYYAPEPDSALWRFGSNTIGYDALVGDHLVLQPPPGMGDDLWTAATAEPRRYGFHATLKAPFRLAAGFTEQDLIREFDSFGRLEPSAGGARLVPAVLKSFVALVPSDKSTRIETLARNAVKAFEPFRAGLDASEMARRLQSPLTVRQRKYLDTYGYPYVFEEFRFHMTLTGALHFEVRDSVAAYLRERIATEIGPEVNVQIDRIVLFRQDSPASRFRIIRAATLR
jgi:hypothetical protein